MEEGKDYLLFMPRSKRGLLADYPELKKYDEFTSISNTQMLFVWCYACKGGPYFHQNISDKVLIEKAASAARMRFSDPQLEQNFMSGKFPHKLRAAIEVMKTFSPTVRLKSKEILEKAIGNIESIISIDLDKNGDSVHFLDKDGNSDWSKKKAYIDSAVKVNTQLSGMIDQAERGFGVTDSQDKIKKNIDETGFTFLEKWHNKN